MSTNFYVSLNPLVDDQITLDGGQHLEVFDNFDDAQEYVYDWIIEQDENWPRYSIVPSIWEDTSAYGFIKTHGVWRGPQHCLDISEFHSDI